jgi:thiamine-triphosphatase
MVIHEIEQKFSILTQLLPRFRSNRGSPPFQHLHFLRTELFEDAYYDSCNKLSNNGLWVRRRAAEWEAKHRKSGDFTRTTFHETNDVSEIQSLIARYTKLDAGPDANFGLNLISRFRTTREVYRADEKFLVVLDATDFGHWVGEVELLAHDEQRAHLDIDAFMRRYAWFFTQEKKPKGKLTAYFEKFGYPGC